MTALETFFWACAGGVAYPYAIYPAALAVLAARRPRPEPRAGGDRPSASIVLAAYNEEATIGRRLDELAGLLAAPGLRGELIVVSDGSTDRTAEVARSRGGDLVRVIELAANGGKAAALDLGCEAARYEVIVFADARQAWDPGALASLLGHFDDPAVGAVGGDLVLESDPGVLAGVGLYWRYEKWMRRAESRLHSTVGVTGAIAAVRRRLFRPIPPGTILDDVYWPLRVVMQGYRVLHDDRARAFDRMPGRARDEFRRKVRTLSGNYQLLARLPSALLPWRNPVWWQLLSHKVARLTAPWALLGMLASGALLASPIYQILFWAQAAAYAFALLGLWGPVGSRIRPASAAASFVVLNAAAWLAFWVWASGGARKSWGKVAYTRPPAGPPEGPVNID